MQCVNPECRQHAQDLQSGTLRLMELSVPPEERLARPESGFPVVVVPTRYFWLCAQCSLRWRMKSWRPEGILLESNPLGALRREVPLPAKRPPDRHLSNDRLPMGSHQVA